MEFTWNLKSFTQDELVQLIKKAILAQLDDVNAENIHLNTNFSTDLEADSVDMISIIVSLEKMFKKACEETNTKLSTDNLGDIKVVKDLLLLIHDTLVSVESKLSPFRKISAENN